MCERAAPIEGSRRRRYVHAAFLFAPLLLASIASAQGVTASGIRGMVASEDRGDVDARIDVRHTGTGATVGVRVARGRFLVQGLEPGGPYTITVRALGFVAQEVRVERLALGEIRDVQVTLQRIVPRLETIVSRSSRRHLDGGSGTTLTREMLETLPTLNRDLYDFLRLVPEVSTRISLAGTGMSAAGSGFRYNSFLINGVSERTMLGGVSSAFAGNRSLPLDAVREYSVLLSPFDVRYGDFTGAMVNSVTQSGTNVTSGSAFVYGRNDHLARRHVLGEAYERAQYGLSLGGPIVRDRLHYFVAAELQHYDYPGDGPFVGQPADAADAVPVSAADLARFDTLMAARGLVAGSAGAIQNRAPLRNLFSRVDVALPRWNSRMVAWHNLGASDDASLSRTFPDTFSLSTYRLTRVSRTRTSAIHLHTALPRAGGGHNELLASIRADRLEGTSPVVQPLIRVTVPAATGGGTVTLQSGTNEAAQDSWTRAGEVSVKENLTLPFGARHVLTLGAELSRFRVRRQALIGSWGAWTFTGLDAFARGQADRYDSRIDFGSGSVPLRGSQYAAYAGDHWQLSDHLSITGGVRADVLDIDGHPPYNATFDAIFDRRTDEFPSARVELSPRIGFVWEPGIAGTQTIRGGMGVFTGRYPLGWAHTALASYGVGGALPCTASGTPDRVPPAFTTDVRSAPSACGGGYTLTPSSPGDVDLLDHDVRMSRVLRGTLAWERRVPGGLVLMNEALFSRGLSDAVLVNLNIAPQSTDGHGRTMYGVVNSAGVATVSRRSSFAEAIELRSMSGSSAWQFTTQLSTDNVRRLNGSASYTWSRVRDIQTPTRVNTRGTVAWAAARVTGGAHEDLSASTSANDLTHRIVLFGTAALRRTRARTDVSFAWVGESGRPFTYLAFGTNRRGDLNADGASNDPVYVPRRAVDISEIQFTGVIEGTSQTAADIALNERRAREAFDAFIDRTPCLRSQRGRIMARNSCREPWTNTTIASIRQRIPLASAPLEVQVDLYNVLNLLNANWGQRRSANPLLLGHHAQAGGLPVFRFNSERKPWTVDPVESAFQLQLAIRYRF